MFKNGYGTKLDYVASIQYYEKAAAQGHMEAQNALGNVAPRDIEKLNIGDCYYYGRGVQIDYAKALEHYHQAAKQGCAGAQNNIGTTLSSEFVVFLNFQRILLLPRTWGQERLCNCN